ncbi:MAG: carboxypeptidase regulatory-like domain-containing protein [Gemmatimonadetes bacterium]|nr:carboxypeptidase regulatory-like domain-containing protein [Gemmatimonadota bacterium]
MIRGIAGALLSAAACVGCAQASTPPGGRPDREPPRVVSVFPAPFDTLADLRAPVRVEFDERLSIRLEGVAELEEAVLVSPVTGAVRVERGRRSMEISVAGGWRPGLVYRVVVLPVFRDLFGNPRREPVELVFSTGAPIPPTAVAGLIEDRVTGAPVPAARVEATRRLDSLVYVAVSDTGGFFSLRSIPAGAYDVRAWLDQDRDRTMEYQEAQDVMAMTLGFQDTVVLAMNLLPMDTTPARLVRAEPVDSMRVRLFFDDHFEPGPTPGRGTVFLLPDSTPVAEGTLIHSTALDTILARERVAADSLRQLRADSIRRATGDTLPPGAPPGDTATAADTAAAARPGQRPPARRLPPELAPGPPQGGNPPAAQRGAAPQVPRPTRELVLVLPDRLAPGTPYFVEVTGVVNIRGIPGGGGQAEFRTPARPDTAAPPPPGDSVPPQAPPPADTSGP